MADQSKPAFDPNKAFEPYQSADKPAFDANQPFELVSENKPLFGGENSKSAQFFSEHPTMAKIAKGVTGSLPVAGQIGGGVLGAASGAVEGAAAGSLALPLVGTISGAAIGGLMGEMAGAGAGGIAGEGLKQQIESSLFGTKPAGVGEMIDQGGLGVVGAGLAKPISALGKAALPVAGSMVTSLSAPEIQAYLNSTADITKTLIDTGGNISKVALGLQSKIKTALSSSQAEIEDPALKVLANNASSKSSFEAGGSAKDLIKQKITSEFQGFNESFGAIQQSHQSLPIPEAERAAVAESIDSAGANKFAPGSDLGKLYNKYSSQLRASSNGQHVDGLINEIKGELSEQFNANTPNSSKIGALQDILNQATNFQEKEWKSLATRISEGKASNAELETFNSAVEQTGNVDKVGLSTSDAGGAGQMARMQQNPGDLKQVAKNFLEHYDGVKANYGAAKDFLNFAQGLTGAEGFGANTVMRGLDLIPNAKLADSKKIFDMQNIEGLRRFQSTMPEAFDEIASQRVNEIAKDSQVKGRLDMVKFNDNVQNLPKEVRQLLFTPEELSTLEKTANNPDLARINEHLQTSGKFFDPKRGSESLLKAGRGSADDTRMLEEISQLTGMNFVKDAQQLSAADRIGNAKFSEMAGRGAAGAAAGAGAGMASHMLSPTIGGVIGGIGGAASTPYAVKLGANVLQNPVAQQAMGQGARSLGQAMAPLAGFGRQNQLQKPGQ